MKKFSFSAGIIGGFMLISALIMHAAGNPPYSFGEAIFFSSMFVVISTVGGFEWGFMSILVHALCAWVLRDAGTSAAMLAIVGGAWYVAVTLLAAHGSRVLMGIASGVLFAGLVLERMPYFSWREWMIFFACFFLQVSGMYFAGNAVKGRWFSPYA